jgi:transposase
MSTPMAETTQRPRRRFDDDFKAQAVRLVLDEGKSVGAVARDLDLTETTLRAWVQRARANRTRAVPGSRQASVRSSRSCKKRIASCGSSGRS